MKKWIELKEEDVEKAVVHFLQNKWKTASPKRKTDGGVDITLINRRCSRYFYIEAKGRNILKKTGKPCKENFLSALGQLCTRMNTSTIKKDDTTSEKSIKGGAYYGLALPKETAKIALKRIPKLFASRNNVYIFSVNDKLDVKRYDYKDFA